MSGLRWFLLPISLVYGIFTWLRNKLFDWHILPSKSFSIPTIGIGNINSGGTGKTPHVEYLAKLLSGQYNIAILSRGYGRKTKGFLQVLPTHTALEVGDEPLMYCTKLPQVIVAVHEQRVRGIEEINQRFPDVNLILLDDAFQHRFVKPSINILLTEYYNPFFKDSMLPFGRLREYKSGAKRADMLVVTKTPAVFPILARKHFLRQVSKYAFEKVFFSKVDHCAWVDIKGEKVVPSDKFGTILLVTGIANTYVLEEHLKGYCNELMVSSFGDHYQFNEADLTKIRSAFGNIIGKNKAIVMTEKDFVRIKEAKLITILEDLPVYIVPIIIVFHQNRTTTFDDFIKKQLTTAK